MREGRGRAGGAGLPSRSAEGGEPSATHSAGPGDAGECLGVPRRAGAGSGVGADPDRCHIGRLPAGVGGAEPGSRGLPRETDRDVAPFCHRKAVLRLIGPTATPFPAAEYREPPERGRETLADEDLAPALAARRALSWQQAITCALEEGG